MAKIASNAAVVKPVTDDKRMQELKVYAKSRLKEIVGNTLGSQTRESLMSSLLNPRLDINYECRYPDAITSQDYYKMFTRNGVAERVVDLWPSEVWLLQPEIYETEDTEDTAFEKEWETLNDDFNILGMLKRADMLSGIGRFGLLLFGISDSKNLGEPVDGIDPITGVATGTNKYELLYLKAYDEHVVTISKRETDKASPRYGLPILYQIRTEDITSSNSAVQGTGKTMDVHWSRVLHVADNRLSSDIFGKPRMEGVYNYLLDLRKIGAGSAEGFWRAGMGGIMFGTDPDVVDPNVTISSDDKDDMKEELEDYFNGVQRYLITQGLKAQDISPKLEDPTPAMETQLKLICITLGIPYRVFMGTEEAKLASGQDRNAWLERVQGKQEGYTTPLLVRPCIQRLQAFGALPQTADGKLIVSWPDRQSPDEGTIAETAVKRTEAMAKYVQGEVESSLMSPEKFLSLVLKFSNDEVKSIMDEVVADLKDEEETTVTKEDLNQGD